jgi:hypothetical protein
MQAPQTYFFLTGFFDPDPIESEAMLAFVAQGNTVFIAADFVSDMLDDTLHFASEYRELWYESIALGEATAEDSAQAGAVNFVNPSLRRATPYQLEPDMAAAYIASFDTARTTVLSVNAEEQVTFIRMTIGEGELFIHTMPLVYTNYALLHSEDAAAYAWRALSYLPPDQDVLWDTQYKPLRTVVRSPLRYVLSDRSLKSAVYVMLLGIVLFMLFEAKRRQRIIPVVTPPRNETLAFVETVGRLYHQRGDHADLAKKKIRFFLEHVRTQFRLSTRTLDETFVHRLADRSGVPEGDVRALVGRFQRLGEQERITRDELLDLHDRIEAFHRQASGVATSPV